MVCCLDDEDNTSFSTGPHPCLRGRAHWLDSWWGPGRHISRDSLSPCFYAIPVGGRGVFNTDLIWPAPCQLTQQNLISIKESFVPKSESLLSGYRSHLSN
ncbi:hypothetical protein AVEN_26381-1 [Araneus ventricosus]|uniref:Uncharacterized protein n=1 Tax=Araneus ventricosus TaxID=182803 RepID=A0A4Y1ZN08_ARAVE|nr:hypothetical protein AVEN_26381-1 [Araneus ventricosus]